MNNPATHDGLAEEAFANGDFSRAARLAESEELRGCSLVLLGALEDGLRLLESSPTPRARYYSALAYWGLSEKERAMAVLATLSDDSAFASLAHRLGTFIERPTIRVLFQGREDPGCPDYDIVGALRAIPYVDLITIGYSPLSDVIIDYSTSLDEVLADLPMGWTPDFFVCHLLEDNPPPIGIEHAPFPTIGHSQDYDRHIQHCFHYLGLMDAMVALGSADHDDLSRLSHVPTYVFPLLLGVDIAAEKIIATEKTRDVFISGTPFSNTHSKAKCIYDITQLPEQYQIEVNLGFLEPDEYYRALSSAKTTFTYVNRWGALNGRAVEAISVGTCALVQEGTELSFFLSEDDGAVPYNETNYVEVLKRVIREWDSRYAAAAARGSKKVRGVFDFTKCTNLYLHFLVHCVLQVDKTPKPKLDPVLSRLRYPNHSPWRIRFHFPALSHLMDLQDRFRKSLSGSSDYIHQDALGESFLYTCLTLRKSDFAGSDMPRALLNVAMVVYKGLTESHPDRLAAWFNLGRICFELGEYETAQLIFEVMLTNPDMRYEITDLLFWREFQDGFFDYDRMMEEMVAVRKDGDAAHLGNIASFIRESAALYLATIHVQLGNLTEALRTLETQEHAAAGFVPASVLRAILRMRAGDVAGARDDLLSALARKPYLLAKMDRDVLRAARMRGLALSDVEHAKQVLDSRLTGA